MIKKMKNRVHENDLRQDQYNNLLGASKSCITCMDFDPNHYK